MSCVGFSEDGYMRKWKLMSLRKNGCRQLRIMDLRGASDMYEKREMWASAYLRGRFCAGFRTTSRCEGINAFVKKFSKSTHTIFELVQSLELVIREYRNKEMLLHYKSLTSVPVMTTFFRAIEEFAARVYTREIFCDVKKEIEGVRALNLVSNRRCLTTMVYTLEEYERPDVHEMASYGRSSGKLDCRCYFWRKNGYPCKHMFFVMRAEHVKEIPESLVLKRWRLDAKSPDQYIENWGDNSERDMLLCHGALYTRAQWLIFVGAQKLSLFKKAMFGVDALCKELEMDSKAFDRGVDGARNPDINKDIRDPLIAKSKGAPKQDKCKRFGNRRRCTTCKRSGHTKSRCSEKRIAEEKDREAEEEIGDNACAGEGLQRSKRCKRKVAEGNTVNGHCLGDEVPSTSHVGQSTVDPNALGTGIGHQRNWLQELERVIRYVNGETDSAHEPS